MRTYGSDWIITFSNSKKHKCLLLCEQECEAGYDFVKTEKYMTNGFKATCHS